MRESSIDGYYQKCKTCQNQKVKDYLLTLDGCITKLLGHAKESASRRNENKTNQSGEFTLIRYDLWNNQKGLCYYSDIQMTLKGAWKISLERLNQKLGYIKSNVVLCCLEYNVRTQWSKDKILDMLIILNKCIDSNYVNFDKNTNKKNPEKVKTQVIDGVQQYICNCCKLFKTIDAFKKDTFSICKQCHNLHNKELRETPRGTLQQLIKSAKNSTKRRSGVKNEKRDTTMDIDYDFLVDLYNNQKGLCAYSDLPLQFGSLYETDWTVSLERIDIRIGYIKTNVCLICVEFQSVDFSILMKDNTDSTTGWNREKFKLFKDLVTKKYKFL
jgi:hypothetical protein